MASLDRSDIEAALRKKGFQEDQLHDHNWYQLYVGGKKTGICTKTSRGSKYKTLSDELVGKMARQLGLVAKEFHRYVDCAMSENEYLLLVQQRLKL